MVPCDFLLGFTVRCQ